MQYAIQESPKYLIKKIALMAHVTEYDNFKVTLYKDSLYEEILFQKNINKKHIIDFKKNITEISIDTPLIHNTEKIYLQIEEIPFKIEDYKQDISRKELIQYPKLYVSKKLTNTVLFSKNKLDKNTHPNSRSSWGKEAIGDVMIGVELMPLSP